RSAIPHDRLARLPLRLNPDNAAGLMVADGAEMLTEGDGPLTVALSEDVPAGLGLVRGVRGDFVAQAVSLLQNV
ncbi:MAG: hypothetical protein K1X50_06365, partial [Candidatus Promineofilum sp.]|nr:hypothetical protein [Promineifilum sp.]